jgi:tRNA1(Val) A37 N6-methylase TrmN6
VPLLLSTRSKAEILGVEIQERLHDMAVRSVAYNELQNQIQIIHDDLKNMPEKLGHNRYDVVTCNPPYFKTPKQAEQNLNEHLRIARHEIHCTLEDVISVSSKLLKQGGKAALVHRPGRLLEIFELMKAYQIEPKRVQFVYPKQGKEANTILVEGIKGGRPDLKILPPLFVYNEQNEYTKEIRTILYGDK